MNIHETVRRAYHAAKQTWTGATWRHQKVWQDEKLVENGEPIYCEGDDSDNCELCMRAELDARNAEDNANVAQMAAAEGSWADAERYAREAYDLENEYGDAPTWGPFLRAVEQARERAERSIEVKVSALDDLAAAGCCRCQQCVERFQDAYEVAVQEVARELGLTVSVRFVDSLWSVSTNMDDEEEFDLRQTIWQEAHERTPVYIPPAQQGTIYARGHEAA